MGVGLAIGAAVLLYGFVTRDMGRERPPIPDVNIPVDNFVITVDGISAMEPGQVVCEARQRVHVEVKYRYAARGIAPSRLLLSFDTKHVRSGTIVTCGGQFMEFEVDGRDVTASTDMVLTESDGEFLIRVNDGADLIGVGYIDLFKGS
jgi:hypothetical protein